MRFYFPESPKFRFFRQKQDCHVLTESAPVAMDREAPKNKGDLLREQEVKQTSAKEPLRRNERANRVLDQIEAVQKWWATPFAASPSGTVPTAASPVGSAAAKTKPHEPLDLQDVPETEQVNGYRLAPTCQRKWFGNPAYAVQSKEQKECLPGAQLYPLALVDANTLKLVDLLKIERIRLAVDKIKSPEFLNSKPVQDALYKMCSRLREGYGFHIDAQNDLNGDLQQMHRRYAFASVTVGERFLQGLDDIRVRDLDKSADFGDDVALALGEFKVYAAIQDANVSYHGRTTRSVKIKEIAIYIMAPYGFDAFGKDVPYLGHFNKKHFALVTDGEWVNAPVYIGKDPHAKNALMRPVSIPHYIAWRQKHNRGGDMLLFSERRPSFPNLEVVVPLEPTPTGTLYWGGAGLNGPYIQPTLQALQNAGISNVYVGKTNSATAAIGGPGTLVDAFRAGLPLRYEGSGEWRLTNSMASGAGQFNLIGYSYGSLLAAQTANYYANNAHKIDHLVLIGSPIDDDFLTKLKKNPNIAHVIVINLTAEGDDIYAGMSQASFVKPLFIAKLGDTMLNGKGEGHFYYGHVVPGLDARLKELATFIYSKGLK